MAFSASEAAFEGFRIVRREPTSVLAWAGFALLAGAISLPFLLPAMATITAASATPGSTPAPEMLLAVGRLYLVIIPLVLITYSVGICAVYRSVLRPADKGLARMRFGADELRMILLMLVFALLWAGASVVVVIVGVLLGAGLARAAGGSGREAMPAIAMVLMIMALFIGGLWAAVRLSLAAPMTFSQRRLRLWSSWRLTRGRFWPLLGSYLLAFVLLLMIQLVAYIVYGVIGLAGSRGSLATAGEFLFRPDMSSLGAYLTPVRMIQLVVASIMSAIGWAITLAPAAVAYREFAGGGPEGQAQAFD